MRATPHSTMRWTMKSPTVVVMEGPGRIGLQWVQYRCPHGPHLSSAGRSACEWRPTGPMDYAYGADHGRAAHGSYGGGARRERIGSRTIYPLHDVNDVSAPHRRRGGPAERRPGAVR